MTKNTTSIFLNRYGYHADFSLSKRALQDYLEAMKIGLRSHQPVSDLAMIPLIFFGEKPDTAGKTVIVIDVGGTNTRAALVEFDAQRRASISAFYHGATPGTNTKKMISKKEFFQGIVSIAEPILDKADNIGICFSYANRTLPDGDAVIAAGGKQIMVEDFIGSTIGVGIREAMRQKGLYDKHRILHISMYYRSAHKRP